MITSEVVFSTCSVSLEGSLGGTLSCVRKILN